MVPNTSDDLPDPETPVNTFSRRFDLDANVLEVVLSRALHADQIVAVGNVQRRRPRVRPRGHAHRVSIS